MECFRIEIIFRIVFNNGVCSLLLWIDYTKSALNAMETVRDVQVEMLIMMMWMIKRFNDK